jgi:hypothetical protein
VPPVPHASRSFVLAAARLRALHLDPLVTGSATPSAAEPAQEEEWALAPAPVFRESGHDVADIDRAARDRPRLYLVHPDRLDDAAIHDLDRLRANGSAILPLSGNAVAAAIADNRARIMQLELEREYGSGRNLFETKNSVIDERFLFGHSELLTRLGRSSGCSWGMRSPSGCSARSPVWCSWE